MYRSLICSFYFSQMLPFFHKFRLSFPPQKKKSKSNVIGSLYIYIISVHESSSQRQTGYLSVQDTIFSCAFQWMGRTKQAPPEFSSSLQDLQFRNCVSKVLCVCWISFCKVFFNIDICILYLQHLSLYFHIVWRIFNLFFLWTWHLGFSFVAMYLSFLIVLFFWKRKGNRHSSFSSPFHLRFYRHLLPDISFPGWSVLVFLLVSV